MIKFTGEECIYDENGRNVTTVKDFWAWAYSNLTNNTLRGTYAEFLVRNALGADIYVSKDEGIRVEVKCSAYLQSWKQANLSKIIFGIPQTHKYDFEADAFDYNAELLRQSDVYVFCVEACQNRDELNERDLSQWDFYVLPTARINDKLGSQKRVSLSILQKIGAKQVSFCDLKAAVLEAYQQKV